MVLVASLQALFFNIAEHKVAWAQAVLDNLSWADAFLQKGTLWLAFLGASLATHHDKHIAIDVFAKLMRPRVRAAMRAFACVGAGVIAFVLASVFYEACVVADASVPFDYEVLTSQGPAHVCDAPVAELGDASRPFVLCALRAALGAVGVPVSSGGGVAQLITPLAFVIIGLRLLARAAIVVLALAGGEIPEGEAASDDGESNAPEGTAAAEGPEGSEVGETTSESKSERSGESDEKDPEASDEPDEPKSGKPTDGS